MGKRGEAVSRDNALRRPEYGEQARRQTERLGESGETRTKKASWRRVNRVIEKDNKEARH